MNNSLQINLGNNSYEIFIQNDFNLSEIKHLLVNRKIAIISNETVAPLYLEALKQNLSNYTNSQPFEIILPDGEPYKNIENWSSILDQLASNGFNRSDLLISLGGGVICDMTGFAAASWMRGIDFIQVPTTLLAQIDASVGGKTGINHSLGKNLIGAFHQPKAVIINTNSLNTLSSREFSAGIGEAVKYGFINQPQFIQWLTENAESILDQDTNTLTSLIFQCCQFKIDIVEQDEKESGMRALLNLGHTFAHAIETMTNYKDYLHGEAVAIGMVMAAELSQLLNIADKTVKQTLVKVLNLLKVNPYLKKDLNPDRLVELMRLDKKVINNKHRLILMNALGSSIIKTEIDEMIILKAITNCLKSNN